MNAHTPGPWDVKSVGYSGGLQSEINGGQFPNRRLVAIVYEMDDTDSANACLIAAAPEMAAELARLRAVNAELVAALKGLMEWNARTGYWEASFWDDARAAIARAEGRAE